ncbi:MAG: hypothetical protein ACR2FX_05940 [Chthoniobacterales bacterium]
MDAAGLSILLKEMEADVRVVEDASSKAGERIREETPGHLEACAYELARLYSAFERSLERICEEFENHFEKRGDYHEKLLQRLALQLDGIRPALLPCDWVDRLRELKGFRHLVRHAYDIRLRRDRLSELVGIAQQLARVLPGWCAHFGAKVREEQGW